MSKITKCMLGGVGLYTVLVYGLQMKISPYIALAFIAIGLFCQLRVENALVTMMFLVPMARGLMRGPINILLLLFLLVNIVSDRKTRIDSRLFFCTLLILLVELIHELSENDMAKYYVIALDMILVLLVYTACPNDGIGFSTLAKSYIIGLMFALCGLIGQYSRYLGFSYILTKGIRVGNIERYAEAADALIYNANELGLLCYMGLALLLPLVVKNGKNKWYLLTGIPMLLGVLLSQSRMAIAMLLIIAVLGAYISGRRISKWSIVLMAVGVCALLLLLEFQRETVNQIFQNFLNRVSKQSGESTRTDIIIDYMVYLLNHPKRLLTGVGLRNQGLKCGIYVNTHNAIQEALVAWGIPGLIVVGIWIKALLSKAECAVGDWKTKKGLKALPFLIFCIGLQAQRLFGTGYYMWFFCVLLYMMYLPFDDTAAVGGKENEIA